VAESIQQITISGHVGRAPETRQVGQGRVTSFSVACNKSRKLPDNTWLKITTWYSVDCWGESFPAGVEVGSAVTVVGEFELARKDGAVIIKEQSHEPILKIRTSPQLVVPHGKRERPDLPVAPGGNGGAVAPAAIDNLPAGAFGSDGPEDDLPF
jgi:hypothetical protein